jgi:hypothetical protein
MENNKVNTQEEARKSLAVLVEAAKVVSVHTKNTIEEKIREFLTVLHPAGMVAAAESDRETSTVSPTNGRRKRKDIAKKGAVLQKYPHAICKRTKDGKFEVRVGDEVLATGDHQLRAWGNVALDDK